MDDIVITLDVDWAPDFAIDFAARLLLENNVHATWFVTHQSPALERLRQHPELFELGIHPNFLPGSTHGETPEKVLDYCMGLAPEAVSMRTHSLVQSTPLLKHVLTQTPITTDVSLFLRRASFLCPVEFEVGGRTLIRVPYYWEDDFEMESSNPCWRADPLLADGEGLKVFDFHPIHIYLNSVSMGPYEELKLVSTSLIGASQTEADRFIHAGLGTRSLFMELIGRLAAAGRSSCIRDVCPSLVAFKSRPTIEGKV